MNAVSQPEAYALLGLPLMRFCFGLDALQDSGLFLPTTPRLS